VVFTFVPSRDAPKVRLLVLCDMLPPRSSVFRQSMESMLLSWLGSFNVFYALTPTQQAYYFSCFVILCSALIYTSLGNYLALILWLVVSVRSTVLIADLGTLPTNFSAPTLHC